MAGGTRLNPLETQNEAQSLVENFDRRVRQNENADQFFGGDRRVFAISPDGHFWAISVDNAGNLITTDFGTEHPSA